VVVAWSACCAGAQAADVPASYFTYLVAERQQCLSTPAPSISPKGTYLAYATPPSSRVCGQGPAWVGQPTASGVVGRRVFTEGRYDTEQGRAINSRGMWAGGLSDDQGRLTPAVTGPRLKGVRLLGSLGGQSGEAMAINAAGATAGYSYNADAHQRAFYARAGRKALKDLGTLGGDAAVAYGLNDRGVVVGMAETAPGDFRPFMTADKGGEMRELTALTPYGGWAAAVNNAGQVTGIQFTDPGHAYARAFITDADGQDARWIESLQGTQATWATGINASGQVVGSGFVTLGGLAYVHALITGPDGLGSVDLNDLVVLPEGWTLRSGDAIDDEGNVLATATDATFSERRLYLLCVQAGCGR